MTAVVVRSHHRVIIAALPEDVWCYSLFSLCESRDTQFLKRGADHGF